MSAEPPSPLSLTEAREAIRRVAPAVDGHHLILIGGQAVTFWQAALLNYLPPSTALVASADVDFQGGIQAVKDAAALLGGQARIPDLDNMTPMSGFVDFTDSEGVKRRLDFLPQPHGLSTDEVEKRALTLDIGTRDGPLPVLVLHPMDVLRSRVANSTLPSKRTPRGWAQLAAAIQIVPAFGQRLLDTAGSTTDPEAAKRIHRNVLNLNESVFRLATKDKTARALYASGRADVSDALLFDERLPAQYLTTRRRQMEVELAKRPQQRATSGKGPDGLTMSL